MISTTAAIVSDRFDDRKSDVHRSSHKPLILAIEDDPDNLVLLWLADKS